MKALTFLLAITVGAAVLVPGAVATAQSGSGAVLLEAAESADDTCDLRIESGGPFEVSIAGGASVVYENGSVVSVPQGSSVNYLRVERTFGSTAIGVNETCAPFVPSADEAPATGSDGVNAPFIAVAVVAALALLGAAWWFIIRPRSR